MSNLFPSRAEQARRRSRLAQLDPPRLARELRGALEVAGFDVAPLAGFLGQLEHPPPPLSLTDASGELGFLVTSHVHDDRARRPERRHVPLPIGGSGAGGDRRLGAGRRRRAAT